MGGIGRVGIIRPPGPALSSPELGAGSPRPCSGEIPALVSEEVGSIRPASGDPKAN